MRSNNHKSTYKIKQELVPYGCYASITDDKKRCIRIGGVIVANNWKKAYARYNTEEGLEFFNSLKEQELGAPRINENNGPVKKEVDVVEEHRSILNKLLDYFRGVKWPGSV